jgi:hypothetical protein
LILFSALLAGFPTAATAHARPACQQTWKDNFWNHPL